MAISDNDFDENVESGDSYTPVLTGDNNLLTVIGTAIEVTSGADGSFNGAPTQGATAFTTDSSFNTSDAFGTRTFTHDGAFILDASIPTGANTFTQNITNTFDDETYALFSSQGVAQSGTVKEISTTLIYNDEAPGSITYNIDDGGKARLIVLTNVNVPQAITGWNIQGASKALDIIDEYVIYERVATSDETGTTVIPVFDGNGNGRGIAKVWVYDPSVAAAGGDLLLTNRSIANYGGMRQ